MVRRKSTNGLVIPVNLINSGIVKLSLYLIQKVKKRCLYDAKKMYIKIRLRKENAKYKKLNNTKLNKVIRKINKLIVNYDRSKNLYKKTRIINKNVYNKLSKRGAFVYFYYEKIKMIWRTAFNTLIYSVKYVCRKIINYGLKNRLSCLVHNVFYLSFRFNKYHRLLNNLYFANYTRGPPDSKTPNRYDTNGMCVYKKIHPEKCVFFLHRK